MIVISLILLVLAILGAPLFAIIALVPMIANRGAPRMASTSRTMLTAITAPPPRDHRQTGCE